MIPFFISKHYIKTLNTAEVSGEGEGARQIRPPQGVLFLFIFFAKFSPSPVKKGGRKKTFFQTSLILYIALFLPFFSFFLFSR